MESDDELERMLCGGLLTDENGMKPDYCVWSSLLLWAGMVYWIHHWMEAFSP